MDANGLAASETGETEPESVLAHGKIERIGEANAELTFTRGESPPIKEAVAGDSVGEAARSIIERLTTPPEPPSGGAVTIDAVGHRIVHGGARFRAPTVLDEAILQELRDLSALAPLHNPAGVAGIESALRALPGVSQVAVFDTAFHHDLPPVAARYALPAELSDRLGLRRFGFHGISYRYVSDRLAHCLTDSARAARVILCHLGNGASVCAVQGGRSVDTSMGFTPLEGLVMGSRSGDVDPGLLLHLLREEGLTPDQLDDLLNHQSGLLGLSGGKSGDMRDLETASLAGDEAAGLAIECFAYRVRKYIGAYAVALGGPPLTLAFTGGIGEHSASMRARICENLDFLGFAVDTARNQSAPGNEPAAIGAGDGESVWVIPTDEERQIARETFDLLSS